MNACMICLEDTDSTERMKRTVSVNLPATHCTRGREIIAAFVQAGIVCAACAEKAEKENE